MGVRMTAQLGKYLFISGVTCENVLWVLALALQPPWAGTIEWPELRA